MFASEKGTAFALIRYVQTLELNEKKTVKGIHKESVEVQLKVILWVFPDVYKKLRKATKGSSVSLY